MPSGSVDLVVTGFSRDADRVRLVREVLDDVGITVPADCSVAQVTEGIHIMFRTPQAIQPDRAAGVLRAAGLSVHVP